MSSSIPHLQAAHWMTSSVVPVNAPVTRPINRLFGSAEALTGWPMVALAAALAGRTSVPVRRTLAADWASVGRALPGGSVANRVGPVPPCV